MVSDSSMPAVGLCVACEGLVSRRSVGGARNRAASGAMVHSGDDYTASENSFVHLELSDGSEVILGPQSSLTLDQVVYERDADTDGIEITAHYGYFIVSGGVIADGVDACVVTTGAMTVHLKSAVIAGRVRPGGRAEVSLLPKSDGRVGEVLAFNKAGAEILTERFHTARVTAAEDTISSPLMLPSGVIAETYAPLGVESYLGRLSDADYADGVSTPKAFDLGAASFEPFQALGDRLFERRFLPGNVFPNEPITPGDDENSLLEDAFDGKRYRLPDEG